MNLFPRSVSKAVHRIPNEQDRQEVNRALHIWTESKNVDYQIECLSTSDFPAAARCISEAFFNSSGSRRTASLKRFALELRCLYSLHANRLRLDAFVVLGVWDTERKKLLACVFASNARDPRILKRLKEGSVSYTYLNKLAVIPEARSKGLGRAMAEAIVFVAGFLGEASLVLSVYADNHRAMEMYFGMGFKRLCLDPRSTKRELKKRPAVLCVMQSTQCVNRC